MGNQKPKAAKGTQVLPKKLFHYVYNEGDRSSLALSPHDINVISIVAQKPRIPDAELLRLIKASRPSKNAFDIVTILVKGPRAQSAVPLDQSDANSLAKWAIANNYRLWARELSASKELSTGVRKPKTGGSQKKQVHKVVETK